MRVVATVTVALSPGFKPVTVSASVAPLGVPAEMLPLLTDGVKV